MAHAILMPQAGQSMTEGTIVSWIKTEGDTVERGEPLLEIETDKANMEVEALESGVLRKIIVPNGEVAAVLAAIGVIAAAGEEIDVDKLVAEAETARQEQAAVTTAAEATPPAPSKASAPAAPRPAAAAPRPRAPAAAPAIVAAPAPAAVAAAGGRTFASPLARRIAGELGVELRGLRGSGPNGRVLRRDVEAAPRGGAGRTNGAAVGGVDFAALLAPKPYPEPSAAPPASVPFTGMRGAIASALLQSKQNIPHYYETIRADVTALLARKSELEAAGVRVSVNDLIVRACVVALVDEPRVNCRVYPDRIDYPGDVNIGIAVGVEEGLVVPVVQQAQGLDLATLATESKRVIQAARGGKLIGMGSGTFTVSNLGMYGIEAFSAIINPPEGALLAVGAARPEVVPMAGGLIPRAMMRMTLSADHRAVDGVLAAQFLARLKCLLETPAML